jgi:hypothetical protein
MFRRGIGRVGRRGLVGTVARTAVVAGTATVVSGGISRHQQKKANEAAEAQAYEQQQQAPAYAPAPQPQYQAPQPQYQEAPQPAAPATLGPEVIQELQQLAQLHQSGVLTDEEFNTQKARLLA